jgi:hypothetical protein
MNEPRTCAECGKPFIVDERGIANHVHPDTPDEPLDQRIDYDADADHVPYAEAP